MRSSAGVLGREGLLADVLHRVAAPGAVVSLLGEPGIGKSTLLVEALSRVEAAWVWSVTCLEVEADLGLSVLGDFFSAVPQRAIDALPDVQRAAVDVTLFRGADQRGSTIDARLLGATILTLLSGLASEGGVVLGIDDQQWCDPTSLAAIDYAAHRLDGSRVAVVSTVRTGAARHLSGAQRLEVPGLSDADMAQLIAQVTHSSLDSAVVAGLVEASAGNPFVARELARHLMTEPHNPRLPRTLRDMLEVRLAALTSDTRSTLVDLAIQGAPRVTDPDIGNLDEAVRAEVVSVVDGRARFAHPLFAAAVLEAAGPNQIRDAHRRAAEVADDPVSAALHRAESSQPSDELAGALDAAADLARSRGDTTGARTLAQLALDRTPGGRRPPDRLLRLMQAEFATDHDERAAELGRELHRVADTPRTRAYALMSIANQTPDMDAAVEVLLQAAATPGLPDEDLQIIVSWTADRLDALGRPGEAIVLLDQALTRETHNTADRWELIGRSAVIRRFAGRPDTTELLEVVRQIQGGDDQAASPSATLALGAAGIIAVLDDHHEDAQQFLKDAAELSRRRGGKDTTGYFAGLSRCRTGQLDDAMTLLLETARSDAANPYGMARVAVVAAWKGDSDAAAEYLARAKTLAEAMDIPRVRLEVGFAEGFAALLFQRFDHAWRALRGATRLLDECGHREPSQPAILPAAVEAALHVDELAAADALCARLEVDAKTVRSSFGTAAALRCHGLLAEAGSDIDLAQDNFAAAERAFTELGLRLEAARASLALGSSLRRVGQRRRARETLESARASFAECGALGLLHTCNAELDRIGGRTKSEPNELTHSERQVVDLVATGMRNAEIAAALHLSIKTIEAHLARAYRKLGVRNRSEVAARLRRDPPHS